MSLRDKLLPEYKEGIKVKAHDAHMTSKHINISASVLFVLSQLFLFLGLDSEEQPAAMLFCTAAMICLASSVVLWIYGLRREVREKGQRNC